MEERNERKHKLLVFGVLYATLLLAILLIANVSLISTLFFKLLRILRPVIIGLVLSYFCNPLFVLFERRILAHLRPQRFRRTLSLVFAYLSMVLIVALLFLLILPQLIDSISSLVGNFDFYLTSSIDYINRILSFLNGYAEQFLGNGELFTYIDKGTIDKLFLSFFNTNTSDLGSALNSIDFQHLFTIVGETFAWIADIILGLFVSIYLLASKEKRAAQIMKFRRAVFSESFNRFLSRLFGTVHRSFGGFLEGKLVDSLIIGILTYVTLLIFAIPNEILIATLVGITNIIPVVGPFIGAIPSAIIIFAIEPDKVILFLILILIIQQIDGNIIGPKILGDNTNVSPLCVVIAVTVMGSLWGFVGMIIGVPLFATVLELAELSIVDRLQKKGLPSGLANYYASDTVVDQAKDSRKDDNSLRKRMVTKYLHLKKLVEKDRLPLTASQKFSYSLFRLCYRLHLFTEPNEEDITLSSVREALREASLHSEQSFDVCVEQACATSSSDSTES